MDTIEQIATRFHLRLLVLFGSQARGDAMASSDVDIAFLSEKRLSVLSEAKLALALSRLYAGKRVDLVDIHHASPLLQRQVFLYGQCLYEKELYLFGERQMYADMLYMEAKPLFDIRHEYLRRELLLT